jgi:hypothetical protein
MDLTNEVHGEILIQDNTTNPKYRGGLLPSDGGERYRCVGEGGEAVGGDSGRSSPSNLPLVVAWSFSVSLFSISASVHHECPKVYIQGFRSK